MRFAVTATTFCLPSGFSIVGAMRNTYCGLAGRGTYRVFMALPNAFR